MTEPISRREAIALGLTRYRTGKACRQGHVAERHVFNNSCCECGRLFGCQYMREKRAPIVAENRRIRAERNAPKIAAAVERSRAYVEKRAQSAERNRLRAADIVARKQTRAEAKAIQVAANAERAAKREATQARIRSTVSYEGAPCPHGHTLRYKANDKCITCTRKWSPSGGRCRLEHAASRLHSSIRKVQKHSTDE